MSTSYVKMTITMEEADGTVHTLDIPKAHHIRIDTRGGVTHVHPGIWPMDQSEVSQAMEIALTADLSETEGYIIKQTQLTTAKEVTQ